MLTLIYLTRHKDRDFAIYENVTTVCLENATSLRISAFQRRCPIRNSG